MTQAAISHHIKTLEDHLRTPLFRRLNRALMLTNAGQSLFPPVREALDGLAEAAARLRAGEAGGTLTVSTLPSFAVKWLVPRMSRFQDHHPTSTCEYPPRSILSTSPAMTSTSRSASAAVTGRRSTPNG